MVLMYAGCGVPHVAEDYSPYELCPGWPDKFYVIGTLYRQFIFVVIIFSFFFSYANTFVLRYFLSD